MTPWLQHAIAAALVLAAWLVTRRAAGATASPPVILALDLAPPVIIHALLTCLTARPITSGVAVLSLAGGLALADGAKRAALREPLVFSDMSEFLQLFRHPQLYLPFAGTGRVIGGAVAGVAAFVGLLWAEPPAWGWTPWPFALAAALVTLAGWLSVRPPLLPAIARFYRRRGPVGEPLQDAAAMGLLAMLFAYGFIARAERAERRAAAGAPVVIPGSGRHAGHPPIVLVQSESFFDARRLHTGIPQDMLAAYDLCVGAALSAGRLSVPGWGANTMRTEFAALTGLTDRDLGFDRFNPYHAFARQPVSSMAWRLRAQGYRTICVHPFDRRFFRRDIAMPNLGFDVFVGPEAFVGARRRGRYVTDDEVARSIADILETERDSTFVFAITMENHGPWLDAEATDTVGGIVPATAQAAALSQYLEGLSQVDVMLARLTDALRRRGPALLGFYGDHLPSLPLCFDALGFDDPRTDYFIWHSQAQAGQRRDLAAHELAGAILDAAGLRR